MTANVFLSRRERFCFSFSYWFISFLFFLSSSFLNEFMEHNLVKQKDCWQIFFQTNIDFHTEKKKKFTSNSFLCKNQDATTTTKKHPRHQLNIILMARILVFLPLSNRRTSPEIFFFGESLAILECELRVEQCLIEQK